MTAFDPVTGKRTDIKRYKKTKTEALKENRDLLNKLEKDGAESFVGDRTRFAYLARKFREEKLIPAVYVGEKKIAGRRELSAPRSWLLQLEYYFGEMKLPSITVGEIKKFEIWLSKIPARSAIVEDEIGRNPAGCGSEASPQLRKPATSVSTLTKTQLRISGLTTTVLTSVIFMASLNLRIVRACPKESAGADQ